MVREIAFRDGRRTVPDHVEALLAGVETWRYTYENAMMVANEKLLQERVFKVQQDMVREHFKVRP